MKLNRFISLALVSALSLTLLSGCAPKEEPSVPEVEQPPIVTTPKPDVPEVETPDVETPDLDNDEDNRPVVDIPTTGDISLSLSDFTLFSAGESHKIEVLNLLSTDTVTYRSSNDAVATVAEDGTVTAIAAGTATITADVLLDGITTIQLTAIVRCNIEEEVEDDTETPAATLDFTAFFEELIATYEAQQALMPMPEEAVAGFFPKMADLGLAQYAVFMPMISVVPSELVLIEVADAGDIDGVVAMLQERIDSQINGGAFYPATIEVWQNHSQIVTNGNFVMLVAAENADDVVAAFDTKF